MLLIDWIIIGLYVAGMLLIGFLFTRKASRDTEDFFVAGRSLPWMIAGTSIVATTFSADTPLFVAGMSRNEGIYANWFWWCFGIGQVASVFFFAKLWHRTEALTDIEFVVKRYAPSKPRTFLRIFKVFYDGVIFSCFIMASVTLAMAKIISVILNFSSEPIISLPLIGNVTSTGLLLLTLGICALTYTALSGLYGVVYTDLIQFTLAMIGSIALAVIVYIDASHGAGFMEKLSQTPGFKKEILNFLPDLGTMDIMTISFLIYIFVGWWAATPGSGQLVQRLLSCKSEKDSLYAFLWYNFCNYALRPWPWIVVGVLSIIYFPDLKDSENCYPYMINRFLPAGLKGIMIASMLAAFMSTLDTWLNCGASYIINDFYRPYVQPGRKPHHYVTVSRIAMVFLTITALIISSQLKGILDAYKYIGVLSAGIGTVMIARWYWWRVGPWSEISAMLTSLIVGNLVMWFIPDLKDSSGKVVENYFALRMLINTLVTFSVWVTVTLIISRKPCPQTLDFYKKMRISGPGWKYVADHLSIEPVKGETLNSVLCWITCCIAIYSFLIGAGMILFHEWIKGASLLGISTISTIILLRLMKKVSFLDYHKKLK